MQAIIGSGTIHFPDGTHQRTHVLEPKMKTIVYTSWGTFVAWGMGEADKIIWKCINNPKITFTFDANET